MFLPHFNIILIPFLILFLICKEYIVRTAIFIDAHNNFETLSLISFFFKQNLDLSHLNAKLV